MDEARQIREFWFGRQPLTAQRLEERMALWFGTDSAETQAEWDEEIRRRFLDSIEQAARGELDTWADGPRRRLSLILLLDQFPRNVFRGTARAFAYDDKALALTMSGIQQAADGALNFAERMFFYMPLQHAELREAQDEAVLAFRRLHDESPPALQRFMAEGVKSAEQHREIIQRFGRFPHRNRVLGRPTTPEEFEFLRTSDSFGQ